MDYEKEYNNALERARQAIKDCGDNQGRKNMIYGIFPELKESEDERTRKEILAFIIDMDCKERWIHWLEKQKEQRPHLELKAGNWYICHRAYCSRADHLTVKEGERFICERDGVVKGFAIKEPEKYFKECGAPASMEDEQKPAEADKDKESILAYLIAVRKYAEELIDKLTLNL